MSLINEALKRAKETHGQAPPPPPDSSGMRPVDPVPPKGTPPWLWIILIVLLVGLGAFLIGQSTHKTTDFDKNVTVSEVPPEAKVPSPETNVVAAVKPLVPEPKVIPEPVSVPSNTPIAVVEPTPPPAPLKLQSIIYDPRRPSAVVSGKVLFVGDRINNLRVLRIQKNSISLVGNGQTNLLELEN